MNLLHLNDVRGAYPASWYYATAQPLAPFPPLTGEARADVVVVGGGFTGLSAALHLAEAGFDVVLLEAQRVGFGASGRNGGQLGSGLNVEQSRLEAELGEEKAHMLWELCEEAKQTTLDLLMRHAPEADFRPGILATYWEPREFAVAQSEALHMNARYGTSLKVLERDALYKTIASPVYVGGILDLSAGHLHPLRFAFGLARAGVRAGVHIFETSEVTAIEHGAKVTVKTGQGMVQADHMILACNGYIGGIAPAVSAQIMPINSFMCATEPLGEQADQLLREDYAVADSRFVVNYFRLSEDRRLLFGGGESYRYRFPADMDAVVRKPLRQVFPQLADVRLDYCWGGTLGITRTRIPIFTRVAANILSAGGYSGHGVSLASFAGKIMALAIAGQAEKFDVFASVPSTPFPGGTTFRNALLRVGMNWYALRDRLGI